MTSFWDRFAHERMSRRRMLAASAQGVAAAGAIAVVGCGGSSSEGPPPNATPTPGASDRPDLLNPAEPPRYGGTLVTANSANFGTFDPHLGVQVASAYFPRVYNVLVNQSPTRPEFVVNDLAESFEIPDETTFVFQIRRGVKVAPNDLDVPERDLDGEDVKATLERIRTDAKTNQYSFGKDYIAGVEVSGRTVTVKTTRPYAWFLPRIGHFFNCIPPRELLAGNLDRLVTKTAGAGAFRLREVTESDRALFDPNPNYYRTDPDNSGARLPYVDGLDVRTIFDRTTQRTAFQSGQIHQYMTSGGEEARSLGGGAAISRDPNFAFISFTMNPEKAPFTDPRVRRAISRATDRAEYVDIVYRGDAQPDGLVHWPLGSYALPADELESTYQPFNLAEARALVEQVGGIKFRMYYPADTTIEEHGQHLPIFLRQMGEAGIDVEVEPVDFGAWVSRYQELSYDSSLALNQIYETPELPLLFHTTGGPFADKSYIQGLGIPEIDEAVMKANSTLDFDERLEAVHAAQRLIYEKDPMFLPLVSPYQHTAFSSVVKNIPSGIGTTSWLLSTYWMDV